MAQGEEHGYPEGPHGIEFAQLQAIAMSTGDWFPLRGTPMQLHTERAAILRVNSETETEALLCDDDRSLPVVGGLAILPSGEHHLHVCQGEDALEPIYVRIEY